MSEGFPSGLLETGVRVGTELSDLTRTRADERSVPVRPPSFPPRRTVPFLIREARRRVPGATGEQLLREGLSPGQRLTLGRRGNFSLNRLARRFGIPGGAAGVRDLLSAGLAPRTSRGASPLRAATVQDVIGAGLTVVRNLCARGDLPPALCAAVGAPSPPGRAPNVVINIPGTVGRRRPRLPGQTPGINPSPRRRTGGGMPTLLSPFVAPGEGGGGGGGGVGDFLGTLIGTGVGLLGRALSGGEAETRLEPGLTDVALGMAGLQRESRGACASGALFRQGARTVRPNSTVLVCNPESGEPVFFKHAGRPILFSGDLTACRRVERVAKRARRASRRGGR